jgi:hypothetical protein
VDDSHRWIPSRSAQSRPLLFGKDLGKGSQSCAHFFLTCGPGPLDQAGLVDRANLVKQDESLLTAMLNSISA